MINRDEYKIGCYIRVSTEEQAKSPEGSIKNQKERLKQAVAFKSLHESFGSIVDTYVDRGKSGKDTNRPELQRLLRDIDSGRINLVAVSELSRISRNIKDFSEIWDMMKSKDCGFYSLRENFDSTTAAGEMVLYSIANIAQFERRQVSERVSANFRSRASRGLYNGGPVPFGYKLIKGKPGYLDIDEEAAIRVRACFEAFKREETLSLAAKWLNEHGYKPKDRIEGGSGKIRTPQYYSENLYKILTNKSYIGVRRYKEGNEAKETKAVWKPIVAEETFYQVQKMLKMNKSKKKPASKERFPYLLSGLVHCAECGDAMCGKSAHGNGGKIGYYEHSWAVKRQACLTDKVFDCGSFKRIGSKKLEPVVIAKVCELFKGRELAQALLEKVKALHQRNPQQSELERVQTNIAALDRQLNSLVSRLSELPEGVSALPIYQHMKKVEDEKKQMMTVIERLEVNGNQLKDEVPELNDYQEFVKSIERFWMGSRDPATIAKALATLIHRVDVSREKLKIHFYIGKSHIQKGAPLGGVSSSHQDRNKILKFGSNSLTNGRG